MSACFHIANANGIDDFRDKNTHKIRSYMLSLGYAELESPTVMLQSKDDVDSFLISSPIKFLRSTRSIWGRRWRSGEIGVWATNFYRWHNFLKSDYDFLIAFEDDLVIDNGFNANIANNLTGLYDVVFMLNGEGENAAAYIISKPGAERALEIANSGVSLPVDSVLARNLNSYMIESKSFCHRLASKSTIQKSQIIDIP